MKRRYFLFEIGVFLTVLSSGAQTTYYYANEKIPIEINEEKVCIWSPKNEKNYPFSSLGIIKVDTLSYASSTLYVSKLSQTKRTGVSGCMDSLRVQLQKRNPNVVVRPVFKNEYTDELILSDLINIKLKQEEDTILLQQMKETYKIEFVDKPKYMPLWYVFRVGETADKNALEIANDLVEADLVASASPEFLNTVFFNECPSDPDFLSQWGLQNRAYPNIDISACDAWDYATGKGMIVAVIDQGIDENHVDLRGNIHNFSYDAVSKTSPAKMYGEHGTKCAGVVGAMANNNNRYIAGVAPDAKLMDISAKFDISTVGMDLADAISAAWRNGADVISCSWYLTSIVPAVKEAIDNALTSGRGGRGCIVVFSSGNDGVGRVNFPASYRPADLLVVGAITKNGEIAAFSNYGSVIDVCAPGQDIFVLKPNNLYVFDKGTSFAAPHVSGLAALILEMNAKLSRQQVLDIIISTTKKVGNMDYIALEDEETWNKKYGYGLIDAYSAVVKAKTYCPAVELKNQTITNEKTVIGCSVNVENVTMKQGGKLNVDASKVMIEGPFSMEAGTQINMK